MTKATPVKDTKMPERNSGNHPITSKKEVEAIVNNFA